MGAGTWIFVGILAAIAVLVAVHFYNRGVTLRNRCNESWSNVDTELLRRHDLIPNLVAAVKGYAKHERQVLERVTAARTGALAHADARQQSALESRLERALGRMLAVAEDNPDLKASKTFLRLQDELALTEDRIQAARRFYNGNVRDYRDHTTQFPGNLFAAIYGFKPIDFFEVDAGARGRPAVKMTSQT